jgi:hypothetical protein
MDLVREARLSGAVVVVAKMGDGAYELLAEMVRSERLQLTWAEVLHGNKWKYIGSFALQKAYAAVLTISKEKAIMHGHSMRIAVPPVPEILLSWVDVPISVEESISISWRVLRTSHCFVNSHSREALEVLAK